MKIIKDILMLAFGPAIAALFIYIGIEWHNNSLNHIDYRPYIKIIRSISLGLGVFNLVWLGQFMLNAFAQKSMMPILFRSALMTAVMSSVIFNVKQILEITPLRNDIVTVEGVLVSLLCNFLILWIWKTGNDMNYEQTVARFYPIYGQADALRRLYDLDKEESDKVHKFVVLKIAEKEVERDYGPK